MLQAQNTVGVENFEKISFTFKVILITYLNFRNFHKEMTKLERVTYPAKFRGH